MDSKELLEAQYANRQVVVNRDPFYLPCDRCRQITFETNVVYSDELVGGTLEVTTTLWCPACCEAHATYCEPCGSWVVESCYVHPAAS